MTSKLVMTGFAAGAALAGMLVGAARFTGVADPVTAVAEEPTPVVRASAAREVSAGEKERWRGNRTTSDVPPGVLARVASRRELERARQCPPADAGEPAGPAAAERCPPEGDGIESVEIDWNGSSATP